MYGNISVEYVQREKISKIFLIVVGIHFIVILYISIRKIQGITKKFLRQYDESIYVHLGEYIEALLKKR